MWTNDYVRIPFEDCGRTREGADCWGLVCIVFKEKRNIILPAMNDYKDAKDKVTISSMINAKPSNQWIEVKKGEEEPFDIPVFKMAGYPMHVGLVVKRGVMLHCERGTGTTVVDYNREQQWFRRLVGFYRYAEHTDSTAPLQSSA